MTAEAGARGSSPTMRIVEETENPKLLASQQRILKKMEHLREVQESILSAYVAGGP